MFGNTLEIPEEVPTFVREVTPTLPPAASGGATAAAAAASSSERDGTSAESNLQHGMKRNYDHLFEEEEEEEEEDVDLPVVHEDDHHATAAIGVGVDTSTRATPESMNNVQARDALLHQQPPTILPVVVAAPKTTGKKKTRFKVKPTKGKSATTKPVK